MDKDWRLVNQHNYLHGKKLLHMNFVPSKKSDHGHCAFCWDKFGPGIEMLHTGYCTNDQQWWICEQCFQDFKIQFEWLVLNADKT